MMRRPIFSHLVYFLKVSTTEQIKLTKKTQRTNCAPGKGINPAARKKKELKKRSWAAYKPCWTWAIVPQKVKIKSKNKQATVIRTELRNFIISNYLRVKRPYY